MCPPQLFSKQDVPQDYAFRSYYGSDPDSFKAGVHKQPQSQARAMLLLPKPPTERVPVQTNPAPSAQGSGKARLSMRVCRRSRHHVKHCACADHAIKRRGQRKDLAHAWGIPSDCSVSISIHVKGG